MILGILQARMSSSRLPGKAMAEVAGAPMLQRQVERLRHSTRLDRLVLATSDEAEDDALAALAARIGLPVVRGPRDDVLARFVLALDAHPAEWAVRLTGDCPLADPAMVDRVIAETLESGAAYGTNAVRPTWPDGLDVEVVQAALLQRIAQEPRSQAEREHVTLAIHRNPDRFRLHHVTQPRDLSGLRWTVDEPRDLNFIRAVYDRLFPTKPDFTTQDVLALLAAEPGLIAINGDIARNEGLAKSLAEELAASRLQEGEVPRGQAGQG